MKRSVSYFCLLVASGMRVSMIAGLTAGLLAGTAHAQAQAQAQAQAPTPVQSQEPQDEPPIHVPTSAWLVGPSSLVPVQGDDESVPLPCLMMNQYDNGILFRLSGGQGRILALAADFRQAAFTPGKTYAVELTVAPEFQASLTGIAHNDTTLLLDMAAHPSFPGALASGKIMRLQIAGRALEFLLLGADDGVKRLNQCYADLRSPPAPAGPVPAPMNTITSNARPQSAAPVPAPADSSLAAALPDGAASDGTGDDAPQETPSPAYSLDAILSKAVGEIEGMKTTRPVSQKDVRAEIESKPAGQRLAQNWASPQTNTQTDPARAPAAPDVKQDFVPRALYVPSARDPSPAPVVRQWHAIKGSHLREVLDVWTATVQSDLIWSVGEDKILIPDSMSFTGSLEDAVAMLLEQYRTAPVRPVGKIYQDPNSLKKVLLVERE